jgi:hypothetical protein
MTGDKLWTLRRECISIAAELVRLYGAEGLKKHDDRELVSREEVVRLAMRLRDASDLAGK